MAKDRTSDSETASVKGGKGRKDDDVRGSRIYPASAPDAHAEAEVRTFRDLVKHKGPPPKTDESSGSE